jgi:hypothetical protein
MAYEAILCLQEFIIIITSNNTNSLAKLIIENSKKKKERKLIYTFLTHLLPHVGNSLLEDPCFFYIWWQKKESKEVVKPLTSMGIQCVAYAKVAITHSLVNKDGHCSFMQSCDSQLWGVCLCTFICVCDGKQTWGKKINTRERKNSDCVT